MQTLRTTDHFSLASLSPKEICQYSLTDGGIQSFQEYKKIRSKLEKSQVFFEFQYFFGHIELAMPVFHIGLIEEIMTVLECVCFYCSKLLVNPEDPQVQEILLKTEAFPRKRLFFIHKLCRLKNMCQEYKEDGENGIHMKKLIENGCGHYQPIYSRTALGIKAKWELINVFLEEEIALSAEKVRNIFIKIKDEECIILGMDPHLSSPSWMILTLFPVSLLQNDQDDQIECILKCNHELKRNLECRADLQVIANKIKILQFYIATMNDRVTHRSLENITLLPKCDRNFLLNIWNWPAVSYSGGFSCIHQLFEEQVEINGKSPAIIHEGKIMNYGQLNNRANQIAQYLIQIGVTLETRVALCADHSPILITALMGILKAGCAYIPLDPAYATQRLTDTLNDASPLCLLTNLRDQRVLRAHKIPIVNLSEQILSRLSTCNPQLVRLCLTPAHLAYIIYISGSTGKPKGVMVEHCHTVYTITSAQDVFCFEKKDIWCQYHSFAFSFSMWEIMGALSSGSLLALISYNISRSPLDFFDYICQHKITVLCYTPSALKLFIKAKTSSLESDKLKWVILTSESLDSHTLKMWNENEDGEKSAVLVCVYGASETRPSYYNFKLIENINSLGNPAPGVTPYLLDEQCEPVKFGVEGELYISSPAIARGYLNYQNLTRESFSIDPFRSMGFRIYRTGDRAKYLPDGSLIYLGRIDHQIIIRGFRIEPREIEIKLQQYSGVSKVVVMAQEYRSETHLTAYIVPKADTPQAQSLRQYLIDLLPHYMIPAAYIFLSVLPHTLSDKLDQKTFPGLDDNSFVHEVYEAPQNENEKKLAIIWSALLGIERISRNDNFFSLGGHSLLAIYMIEKLNQVGLKLSIQAVFDKQSLADLADTLDYYKIVHISSNLITIKSSIITANMLPLITLTQNCIDKIINEIPGSVFNIQDIYSLVPLQQSILLQHLKVKRGDPYLMITQFSFTDNLALKTYVAVLQHVVMRHDVLRTSIIWEGLDEPAQVVWREVPTILQEIYLDGDRNSVLKQLDQKFNAKKYSVDLGKASLLHLVVSSNEVGEFLGFQLIHYLIIDQFTHDRLYEEVELILSEQSTFLKASVPYRNMVALSKQDINFNEHEKFFKKMLRGVEEPTVPFGLITNEERWNDTELIEAHIFLPITLGMKLYREASRLKVSVACLCHLAMAKLLASVSGYKSVVFGTVLFGQYTTIEKNNTLLGLLTNTLPIQLDVDEKSIKDSVFIVYKKLTELLQHHNVPLSVAQHCSNIPILQPLFNAVFNYRHYTKRNQQTNIQCLNSKSMTHYPLGVFIDSNTNLLSVRAQIVLPHLANKICVYIEHILISLTKALAQNEKQVVQSLTNIPKYELILELNKWKQLPIKSENIYDCIHLLFEDRVHENESRTAIEFEGEIISYKYLNEKSNHLAHYLICIGLKHGTRVGLHISRGLNLIVAIIGIIKSGGTYIPLDPVHTSKRLNQILYDSQPILLLLDTKNIHKIELTPGISVEIAMCMKQHNYNPKQINLVYSNLVCITYTSGSMGVPKGVMIEHGMIVNLFHVTQPQFVFNYQDKWCLISSYGSDFSLWEIWGALLFGGQLGIVSYEMIRLTYHFHKWVYNFGLTVLNQTPSAFRMYLEIQKTSLLSLKLRYIILAREVIDINLLNLWYKIYPKTNARLYNIYGCTETIIYSTINEIQEVKMDCSIGYPLPDVKFYLIDTLGEIVPFGAVGELYIGGPRISSGYINKPEQTAQHFLPDHFADNIGERIYRTGDLAHYLPDGRLMYLGRKDKRIKTCNFCIKTAETEKCLTEGSSVGNVVVVPKEFMVPAAYIPLDKFPMTPDRKLDTKSLSVLDWSVCADNHYEGPIGAREEKLASIWCSLLNLDHVSRQDNFFALGGHSLLIMETLSQLRQEGLNVDFETLFEAPTLAFSAASLNDLTTINIPPNLINTKTKQINPYILPLIKLTQVDINVIIDQVPGGVTNIQDVYHLTPLQHGMLFHHILASKRDPYLSKVQVQFRDKLVLNEYIQSLSQVIKRHEILRTAFIWEDVSEPAQVVWHHVPSIVRILQIKESEMIHSLNLYYSKIDLTKAPLIYLEIGTEIGYKPVAQQIMHHLVYDMSSIDILYEEIESMYSNNDISTLPIPIPFRNFVAQSSIQFHAEEHTQFFTNMLSDIDEPTYPFLLSGNNINDQDECNINETSIDIISPSIVDILHNQALNLNVSFSSVMHLVFARFLSSSSECQSVVFGTVLFGRIHGAVNNAVGMGLWINTLPLRLNVDKTPVAKAVCDAHSRLSSLLAHEHASLALAQRCSSVDKSQPLFSALFNFRQRSTEKTICLPGVNFVSCKGRTNYPLSLSIDSYHNKLGLVVQVEIPVSSDKICIYIKQTLKSLSKALVFRPNQPIQSLAVVHQKEHIFPIGLSMKSLDIDVTSNYCIHQLFELQIEKHCSQIALKSGGKLLSYQKLNEQANQLAHYLICIGLKPNDRIGLCISRGFHLIVAILGIMKSGGTYIPLDPVHTSQRLNQILYDSQPILLLSDEENIQKLELTPVISVEMVTCVKKHTHNPKIIKLVHSNLAYIMYTSGSTGVPKGVMIEHRMIVCLFHVTQPTFDFNPQDKVCLFSSYGFDVSVWEMWGALLFGGQLGIVSYEMTRMTYTFYEWVCYSGLTVLTQTPSALRMYLEIQKTSSLSNNLRYIIIGGEVMDQSLLKEWYKLYPKSDTRIYNMYGCTESTVISTFNEIDNVELDCSIGYPLPDVKFYLFDSVGELVPFGAVGELYFSGPRISCGYINRPEETAQHFFPDHFANNICELVYRTGDLAYFMPDGRLMYVGRKDKQIKIRGYRIETAEIEKCLTECSPVINAVVVPSGDGMEKILVAYIISKLGKLCITDLKRQLSLKIPEFMVPTAYILLDELPLTPNGKLDTKSLPVPERSSCVENDYEEPIGTWEEKLASIWCSLLNLDHVSRQDNFFTLGGHSLLIIQMLALLRQSGLNIDVRTVYLEKTLASMANAMEFYNTIDIPTNLIHIRSTKISPNMLPLISLCQNDINKIIGHIPGGVTNLQDIYSLTPLQQGILFHTLIGKTRDPYLMESNLSFNDKMVFEAYLDALQYVTRRHDTLRTSFIWQDINIPAQVVWRFVPSLLVKEVVGNCKEIAGTYNIKTYIISNYSKIDLTRASLITLIMSHGTDGHCEAYQILHHLIMDHISLETLFEEINIILSTGTGLGDKLTTPVPFRNLVAQVCFGISESEHTLFFTEMLGNIEEPTYPFQLCDTYCDGTNLHEFRLHLSHKLNKTLRTQVWYLKVSLATLCHIAFAKFLSSSSGNQNVVFGTVLFGRLQGGPLNINGFGLWINTLPLRINIDSSSVEDTVYNTHSRLSNLLNHEYASLTLAEHCTAMTGDHPLFSALLNFRHQKRSNLIQPPAFGISYNTERTNYPLNLSVENYDTGIGLTALVMLPVSSYQVCKYIQHILKSLSKALTKKPLQTIQTITVLPRSEQRLMFTQYEIIQTSMTDCIHQLFEVQIKEYSKNIALEFQCEVYNYQKLNEQANLLAHYLIQLGLKPNDRIGLCISRGFHLIVAILGIMKSGGTYIPLDPVHTSQRLNQILYDSQPILLLSDEENIQKLELTPVISVEMVTCVKKHTHNPKIIKLVHSNLAYIMYTSGSTGVPKGVMIEHRMIVCLFHVTQPTFDFNPQDKVCLFSSYGFDVSVWEMWGALLFGGQLGIVSYEMTRMTYTFYEWVCYSGLTVLTQTPSALRMYLEIQKTSSLSNNLRYIIIGGEVIDTNLLNMWYKIYPKSEIKLYNMYGCTETTVIATSNEIKNDKLDCSIGYPLPDVKFYLIDSVGDLVPFGAVGELYIGGPRISCGYMNRLEQTAQYFLPDHFSSNINEHIYRTGDLAYYMPDWRLMYVGRNDKQIKVRGYRIETAEIVRFLIKYPQVKDAVVLLKKIGMLQHLVAYIVSNQNELSVYNLHQYLVGALPNYMIPTAFILIPSIPLTINGKLDHTKLPELSNEAFASHIYEAPKCELEQRIVMIWSSLLGINTIGRDDNFFELGGNSFLAIQFISQAKQFGMKIEIHHLFQYPVLRDLAMHAGCNFIYEQCNSAIPVRLDGEYPPLFLLPTGLKDYSYAFNLARVIDSNFPVYILPWPSSFENQSKSMEDMATRMVYMMKLVRSNGPFLIAGYSSGGILAYEVANQLANSYNEVLFVGLIDTYPPIAMIGIEVYSNEAQLAEFFILRNKLPFPEWWKHLPNMNLEEAILKIKSLYIELKMTDDEISICRQCQHYKMLCDNYKIGLNLPRFHMTLYKANSYDNPVEYVDSQSYIHMKKFFNMSKLGWELYQLDSNFTVIPIIGNHQTIIQDMKNHTLFAEKLSQSLVEAISL